MLVIVAVPVVAVVRGRMVGRGGCGWVKDVMGAKKLAARGHTRCVTRENCPVGCFGRKLMSDVALAFVSRKRLIVVVADGLG